MSAHAEGRGGGVGGVGGRGCREKEGGLWDEVTAR